METPPNILTTLRIEYDAKLVPKGGAAVLGSFAAPVADCGSKEWAGHSYHRKQLICAGLVVEETEEEEDEPAPPSPSGDDYVIADDLDEWEARTRSKKAGKGKKGDKKKKKDNGDMYAMLDLADLRFNATDKDIKDAYRKASLRYHPDKCQIGRATEEERERIEERFKQIQFAFETLSDPTKRRVYDSTDGEDVKLPMDCEPGNFFRDFEPAFRSLARWSEKPGPPLLGDAATPWETISAFYDFWFAFKSWREFPHEDEEDPETADCREHRRFIERSNAKLREKAKKEETAEIKAFVEAAYRFDPRVQARLAEEKAAKQAKKDGKKGAARAAAEEQAKREEEARLKAEEAERAAAEEREAAKKNKEAQRKALQKEKKRLRTAAEAVVNACKLASGPDDIDRLCSGLELEPLQKLCSQLEAAAGDVDAQAELLTVSLCTLDSEYRRKQAEAAERNQAKVAEILARQEEEARKKQERKPWTADDVKALDKALKQFPHGSLRRWEQIAAYMGDRTAEEVLEMSKLKATKSAATPVDDFNRFLEARTKKGSVEVKDAVTTRLESFTDVQVKLTGEAAAVLLGAAEPPGTPGSADVRPQSANGHAKDDGDVWSEVQEVALVKAVKTFAKGCKPTEKERWALVAEAVPGKNAAQCTKHFAVLKDRLKTQAAAGGDKAAANGNGTANGNGNGAQAAEANGRGDAAGEGEQAAEDAAASLDEWSEMQEILLARALKTHPKGSHPTEKDRWVAIAQLVPGRTAPQCKAHFAVLKEKIAAKKGTK